MRNFTLFLFCLLFIIACEKENTSNLNLIRENLKTNNTTTSEFILKNDTVVRGRFGTEIFIPKDLFENYNNGKIQLELKEFYRKEDMILNGLSTITDKDELLESSGMLYINFTEERKELKIRNGKSYKVFLAENVLENSNLYSNENDSIFKWKLEAELLKISFPDIIKNYQYKISVDDTGLGGFFKETISDSLKIVQKSDSIKLLKMIEQEKVQKSDSTKLLKMIEQKQKNNDDFLIELFDENHNLKDKYQDIHDDKKLTETEKEKRIANRNSFFNITSEIYTFTNNKLGWINIDKVLKFDVEKKITISNNDKLFNNDYVIFYNYLERKSLINHILLNFNTPYKYDKLRVFGKMKIVIYTNDNDKIYYDTFYLDKNSKSEFEIHLKETTIEKLKEILITK